MKKIDLNCDMGESMAGHDFNIDRKMMPFISSCNIACGFHSGSPLLIEQTIKDALEHDLKIGAHPSYDDRENFGRKSIDIEISALLPQLRYQICVVKGMVESLGGKMNHVKAHGALYNDMVVDENLAKAFVELIKEIDGGLQIYGLAGSPLEYICNAEGLAFVNEGFADRRYDTKTKLRNRKLEGSVLSDLDGILKQVDLITKGRIQLYSGEEVNIKVDSVCIHSDTPGALDLCRSIFEYLRNNDVEIG